MIILYILAIAILLDVAFNTGNGLKNIIHGSDVNSAFNDKFDAINKIKDELDELYDDLSYNPEEFQLETIKSQIRLRETIINELIRNI